MEMTATTADQQAEADRDMIGTCVKCGDERNIICCGKMNDDWTVMVGECIDCCDHTYHAISERRRRRLSTRLKWKIINS